MGKQLLSFLIACAIVFAGSQAAADDAAQWIDKGKDFSQKGDFEHAAISWDKAKQLLDKEKDRGRYIDVIVHICAAYQSLGYHQKALALFHETLPIIEKNTDHFRNAQFLSSLADLYLSLGNTNEADKYLNKGLEEARQTNNPRLIASVLMNAGNLLTIDHDYEGAMDAYSESLELVEEQKSGAVQQDKTALKSKILLNLLYVSAMAEDDENIKTTLDKAFLDIESLPNSHNKASAFISLSLIIRNLRKDENIPDNIRSDSLLVNTANRSLNRAKDIALDLNDSRSISSAYGYLGEWYEEDKHYSDAMNLTRSAIFYANQGNDTDILYLWQWQMGRLFKSSGDIENAVKSYTDSISTLNPIRGELFRGLRLEKDTFNEQIKPVFLGLAELYLNQAETIAAEKKGASSKAYMEKIKAARDTMEILKTAELQDFFKDECTTLLQSKMTSMDRTPPHTAVIYPIVLPKSLAILLTLPDGMHHVQVPLDAKELKETVTQFRHRLQNRMNNRFLYDSEKLYNWIIRPIEQKLSAQEIDTLVIAPDGVLRLIPMSALSDGSQYLVEKFAIAIIPAVTLTDPKPFQQDKLNILLCGLSEARQDFSALPSVPAELSDIKQIMSGNIVLMNQDFSIPNLTNEFKTNEYAILHLATHGVFGGTPTESFLLNYDTKLTMDKLEQLIGIARFRDKPVELLTLSACQTALGNERAALGLAGVAVKAGVRSAIATLWYVDDEATSLAIREFYRQIKTPGMSKAKALQNVQKKLIAKPRYWQPLYWAPFLLIGNWM